MAGNKITVCPVERAGALDSKFRRRLQNPRKILGPYVREGMTVLDVGCGPGFFSVEIANMVGASGRVISADLQEPMLDLVRSKIKGTELENRVTLVLCDKDKLNVTGNVDMILAFYVAHEVPDKDSLFSQLDQILKPDGVLLLIEPKLFHVSKIAFKATVAAAERAGFKTHEGPKLPFSWSALLRH